MTETFPRLRSILAQLLFPPIVTAAPQSDAPKIATLDEPDSDSDLDSDNGSDEAGTDRTQDLRWGWAALTPRDKLEILAFLCDLAMTSRGMRSFLEDCDARLTTLRKEKIEVNRERKRVCVLVSLLALDIY